MKKQTIKLAAIAVIIIIAAVLAYRWYFRPTYPDIYNPKPYAGNTNASVFVEEFSDFQCPYCGKAEPVVEQILSDYGDRIKLRYAQFPLVNLHPYAYKAAEASECANDQGKFWPYHDMLFRNQDDLSRGTLLRLAQALNLDMGNFTACLDSDAKASIVDQETNEGIRRGVQGTPTFFIDGKQLSDWSYESFKAALDAELNKTKTNQT